MSKSEDEVAVLRCNNPGRYICYHSEQSMLRANVSSSSVVHYHVFLQAFILDPDGYSIEVLGAEQMAKDFTKYTPGGATST